MEVSSKTKEGVDNLFGKIAAQCYESRDKFVSMKIENFRSPTFTSKQPPRIRNTFKLKNENEVSAETG